jgi:hypothetical protein
VTREYIHSGGYRPKVTRAVALGAAQHLIPLNNSDPTALNISTKYTPPEGGPRRKKWPTPPLYIHDGDIFFVLQFRLHNKCINKDARSAA